jgi:hypothetical protein
MTDENNVERRIERLKAELQALRAANRGLSKAIDLARDVALEEAATEMGRIREARAAIRIRDLKTQPARRFVDVERVRDVLVVFAHSGIDGWSGCVRRIAHDLGVAIGAEPKDTRMECTCLGTCKGPEGLGPNWRCALGRSADRELAAVANGLLPAPRKETKR